MIDLFVLDIDCRSCAIDVSLCVGDLDIECECDDLDAEESDRVKTCESENDLLCDGEFDLDFERETGLGVEVILLLAKVPDLE